MWTTILYILLFLIFLSVLITIHEFGHFIAAKCFKVYCTEFSIGFGPALIHKRRKGGETFFSLRAIPFGGYVAMYDEKTAKDNPVKDEKGQPIEIPSERSFGNIAKWKRVIVLFAGVTMNAVLALVLFFISSSCFVQQHVYVNVLEEVAENSPAALAGLVKNDVLSVSTDDSGYYVFGDGLLHYNDGTEDGKITLLMDTSLLENYTNRDLTYYCDYYFYTETTGSDGKITRATDYENPLSPYTANYDYLTVSFDRRIADDTQENGYRTEKVMVTVPIVEDGEHRSFENLGITYQLYRHWNTFSESVKKTFSDFGESATVIVRSIGSLFTSTDSWKNMGGIVAIGVTSSNVLANLGWSNFLYLWGMISVNLAIINLIPFPGLDGWQILVIVIEAIARKPVPDKVKGIVQFVGIAILFVLMALLVVKDLFTYIF